MVEFYEKENSGLPYTMDQAYQYGSAPRLPINTKLVVPISGSTKRISLIYGIAVAFYAASGLTMLIASVLLRNKAKQDPAGNGTTAALVLALKVVEFREGIVAGSIVLLSVLLTTLGSLQQSRTLLQASSVVNILSMFTTLGFGLSIWFATLVERQLFFTFWLRQSQSSMIALQDKFNCCGYLNSSVSFLASTACPSASIAASKPGCIAPVTAFADVILNLLFTLIFGLLSFALVALLSGLVLAKRITEEKRFMRIELKKGAAMSVGRQNSF